MKKQFWLALFSLMSIILTSIYTEFYAPPTEIQTQAQDKRFYLVTKIIDGDTIEIEGGQKIRYIGIDTPEISFEKECLGKEAKEANMFLVENKYVRLEKDVSETDRYGRLLRYVYIDDVLVNEKLVKEGFAQARSYPPDISKQDVFNNAELEARNAKKGLWGTICNELLL